MKLLEPSSPHQLAAAVVAGTSAFGELLAGPLGAPLVELGASLATSAIAAHAASRRLPVAPAPRLVGQALLAGARTSGARCASARWLRLVDELRDLPGARQYALRSAGRAAVSIVVGGGARAALGLIPGLSLGVAGLQAVISARDAWRFVGAVERESLELAPPAPSARLAARRPPPGAPALPLHAFVTHLSHGRLFARVEQRRQRRH